MEEKKSLLHTIWGNPYSFVMSFDHSKPNGSVADDEHNVDENQKTGAAENRSSFRAGLKAFIIKQLCRIVVKTSVVQKGFCFGVHDE